MRRLLTASAAAVGLLSIVASCHSDRAIAPKFGRVNKLASISTPSIVISQIYGGGGGASSAIVNDYIELFNPGVVAVNISGWSVQYQATSGTTWSKTNITSGIIPAGGYFLIQESGGSVGAPLPTPDLAGGTISMAQGAGKVVLINNQTALVGAQCPTVAGSIIDFVPYGTGGACSPATATLSQATAAFRKSFGCTYDGNPSTDFEVLAAAPRNSASTKHPCTSPPLDHVVFQTPVPTTVVATAFVNLTAIAQDVSNNPITATYAWTSSDTTIALVDPTGATVKVTGVTAKANPATITVQATANGITKSASTQITVTPQTVASVVVTPTASSIAAGTTQLFTAKAYDAASHEVPGTTFTWSSDNTALATVDAGGLATGQDVGIAHIKAKTNTNVEGSGELTVTAPAPVKVVVSQIYGGGGNNGGVYKNDFIELFNPGDAPVDITGWSVQQTSATGTGTWSTTSLSGTIQPHKYYLVQEGPGTDLTQQALPTPDASGTIALGATSGKVLLTRGSTANTGACPSNALIVDKIGYGAGADPNGCATAWGRTAAPANGTAVLRKNDGCVDTDNSANDFSVGTPTPRNSASPLKNCSQPTRPQSDKTIVINELMADPANAESASWGQWFEVYNYGSTPVDLNGWTIVTQGTNQPDHVISHSVVVPAGGYAVLGRGDDMTRNGGVHEDYNYFSGINSTIWLDDDDFLMLVDNAGARVDSTGWHTPLPHGSSKMLRDASQENADVDGGNWGYPVSTSTFGDGDFGTPGAANTPIANTPVFVSPNHVTISGRTATDDPPIPVGFEAQIFASEFTPLNVQVPGNASWSSLTPAIATIDTRGVIHSVAPGTAIFRATFADGAFRNYPLPMETGTSSLGAQYGNGTEFGDPLKDGDEHYIIRRPQYVTSYNKNLGQPNWVSYNLNATHFALGSDRCNCFTPDPMLPASFPVINTADYTGAGSYLHFNSAAQQTVDRGHMTRSSDRTGGSLDNAITYYLSNVVPQIGDLNQGPWNNMESALHAIAATGTKDLWITQGPAGNYVPVGTDPADQSSLKGESKVHLPGFTWKFALIMNRGQTLADVRDYRDIQVIAAIMPNKLGVRNDDWHIYSDGKTINDIEQLSGYRFLGALPGNIQRALKLQNFPPIAKTSGPYNGFEGAAVALDGSTSVDPNGSVTSYNWLFSDGGTASGATPSHVFAQDGNYTARLIVTDNDALVDTIITQIHVANVAPTVGAIADASVDEGSTYAASGSFTDPGDDAYSATVDYGDGSGTQTLSLAGNSFSLSHVYRRYGSFGVTVRVSDGVSSGTQTATITVANVAPTLSAIAGGTILVGNTFTSSGTFTDPGSGDPFSATVDYGDGSGSSPLALSGNAFSLSHAYASFGSFQVTVTLSDGLATTSRNATVTVQVPPVANAGGPYATTEGSTLILNGAGSSDADGPIASYAWTFSDGGSASGASVSHTYAQDGSYSVQLTVTDADGLTNTTSTTVTVMNVPPSISAIPGATIVVGGTFTSGGSFADPGSDVCTATVDYGDGTGVQALVLNGNSFSLSHVYATHGTKTVTVSISDDRTTTLQTTTVIVQAPPVANAGGPYAANEGSSVALDGSSSHDVDGTVTTYAWSFGDGATASDASPSHTYTNDGTFTVTLTVTDNDNLSSTTTTSVTVSNVAPSVSAIAGNTILVGDAYASAGSFTDPGADTWSATVNYGDGTGDQPLTLSGKSFTLSHTYAAHGQHTVVVTVSDGAATATTSAVVVVHAKPVANAGGPYTASEGSSVTLNGAGSSDPDGSVASYAWTFGDGGSSTDASPSHTYANDGSFTVTLTVTDNDGLTNSTTTSVTVSNVAPSVAAFSGATILPHETYSASGSFTDPGADAWSATVNYGDGSGTHALALNGNSFSLSHTYSTAGTYTVTVSVRDGAGTGTRTATVKVSSFAQGAQDIAALLNGNTSLNAKLNAAIQQLNNGNTTPALNQLNALLNEVDAMVRSRRMESADANAIRAAVNRLMASITG